MANHSDDEDFRGRKKQARILGYDAEAWIKARREEREQFKSMEGTDMEGLDKLARDPRMDALQKGHQERQGELDKLAVEKSAEAEQRQRSEEVLQAEVKKLSEQQQTDNQETQEQNHEQKSGRSM